MTLIIALDSLGPDARGLEQASRALCPYTSGFKLGWPNIAGLGDEALRAVRRSCPDKMVVADLKLADIGYTMRLIVDALPSADAYIAHAFPGEQGALDELSSHLRGEGKKLVLVVSMSHPGSREVMDPCLNRLVDVARRVSPWGVVAPATRPWIIGIARRELGPVKILSPGVGAQGAEPGSALRHGADYEIVGRLILGSGDPVEAARRVLEAHARARAP